MKQLNSNMDGNKTKWMKKSLTSSVSSTTSDISDLQFNGLVSGKTYRVFASADILVNGSSTREDVIMAVQHDATTILNVYARIDGAGDHGGNNAGNCTIFTATAASLNVNVTVNGTGNLLSGSVATFIILEELPNHVETNQW